MRTTIAAVTVGVVVMIAVKADALHRQTPFEMSISRKSANLSLATDDSERPFCQGQAARYISFHSSSDLKGNGSVGTNIFLQDNDPAAPRTLYQVTNCAVGTSMDASTDANGSTVVFDSNSDLKTTPAVGCQVQLPAREIYTASRTPSSGWQYTLLTTCALPNGTMVPCPADSINPKVDANGNKIAFESLADVRGNGSTGSNIYMFRPGHGPGKQPPFCDFISNPPCSNIMQVTPPIAGPNGQPPLSRNPQFNLLITHIIFESNASFDHGGSNGFFQIWLWPISQPEENVLPIRLTNGNADSIKPSMSQDARLVVFQSKANLAGTANNGSWQIFLLDRDTGQFRQLTNGAGDSTDASMGGGGRFITFVSTADLLQTGVGTGGPHLFLYDLIQDTLYQVTNSATGSSGHPVSTADTIFFFDSSEDPMHQGFLGRQVYALNVFQQVPLRALGPAKFNLQPGQGNLNGSGGSSVRLLTEATLNGNPSTSYIVAPIGNKVSGAGVLNLNVIGRNFDGEGAVTVSSMIVPPIPVPSFGAICLTQTSSGRGTIDCDGGRSNINVHIYQDHNTHIPLPDADPNCLLGCVEGVSCPSHSFVGPDGGPCPRCTKGVCAEGPLVGQSCDFDTQCPGKQAVYDPTTGAVLVPGACTTPANGATCDADVTSPTCCISGPNKGRGCSVDAECPATCMGGTCDSGDEQGNNCTDDHDCDPNNQCQNGRVGVCEGPPVVDFSGTFGPGDMVLTIPVTARISTGIGKDQVYCTADDTYALSGIGMDSQLVLTTGTVESVVADVDNKAGQSIGGSEIGSPFSCDNWSNKDLSGARLVGALTYLNVPVIPKQLDTILTFRLQDDPGAPCPSGTCPAPCSDNSGCDDGNPCNGIEFCNNGNCAPGVPVSCSDGNDCNGLERCAVINGQAVCQPGAGQACDDNNPCTTDSCDTAFGCIHTPVRDGLVCDDHSLCTVNDQCVSGQCTGTVTDFARNCNDGNACNGIETCDPTTGNTCLPGTPLVCTPDNNPCTTDTCDPVLGCNFPNTLPCNDNNACTGPDVCTDGTCVGPLTAAAAACNLGDGNPCNGIEHCDAASGACVSTVPNCDDLNPCTDDSCDPAAPNASEPCVHVNNNAGCNDGNACTTGDVCAAGRCAGTLSAAASACNLGDGNVCDGIEQCNTTTGACDAVPLNCDDGNPCTADSCDALVGCMHVVLTGVCNDGNACTVGDECVNGACLGAPTATAQGCDDHNVCDGIETCDATSGACVPGTPLNCDDGDACTTDTCDPVNGCVHQGGPGLTAALCQIDNLVVMIKTRPFGSIRGRKLPQLITKLVFQARTKVQLAGSVSDPKALKLLSASDKKLLQFMTRVTKASGNDRIPDAMFHALTSRALDARTSIKDYMTSLR